MNGYFERTRCLVGDAVFEKIKSLHVAVFGIGGVGGYVAESLVRCGVSEITLIDNDTVSESNINRQIFATVDMIGKDKTEAAAKRLLSINPYLKVNCINEFFMPDTSRKFDFKQYDYVVDAIDTVTGKIEIVLKANEAGTSVISCMGTGNKLDPKMFEIDDIYNTSVCPLAKVMRYELKKRGVKKLKVLYSKEKPLKPAISLDDGENFGRHIPASISYVPSVAGLIICSEIINDTIKSVAN